MYFGSWDKFWYHVVSFNMWMKTMKFVGVVGFCGLSYGLVQEVLRGWCGWFLCKKAAPKRPGVAS